MGIYDPALPGRAAGDEVMVPAAAPAPREVYVRHKLPFRRWVREIGWRHVVALLAVAFALFPIATVLTSSVNTIDTLTTVTFIPNDVTLDNYTALFEGCSWDLGVPPFSCASNTPFPTWLWNSVKVAFIATIIQLALSCLAAFSFARLRWRGRRTGLITILLIQMFPQFLAFVAIFLLLDGLEDTFGEPVRVDLVLVMIVLVVTAIISFIFSRTGEYSVRAKRATTIAAVTMVLIGVLWFVLAPLITNWLLDPGYGVTLFPAVGLGTHTGLILVYLGGAIGVNTWLIKGFMDSIPISLDEAAKVDGASEWFVFWKIVLPLSRPILIVIFILTFVGLYNEFILASVLVRDVSQFTYATGLALFVESEYSAKWGQLTAAAVVGTIPILVLFMALQDRIVSGLQGAVKG